MSDHFACNHRVSMVKYFPESEMQYHLHNCILDFHQSSSAASVFLLLLKCKPQENVKNNDNFQIL